MEFRSTPQYPTYHDWVRSPVYSRLWTLMFWKLVIQNARVYLINSNLVTGPRDLPGYYDFAKRVYFHIRNSGYAGAVPLVESERDLFKGWGFSGVVLRGLALLQGVRVEA
jgi:hypothetical protein